MAFDYGNKIRALINLADDPATPDAARAAYREKAEQLMRDYRIAEENALATDPGAAAPVWVTVRLTTYTYGRAHDLDHWYNRVMYQIADHAGCQMATEWDGGYVAHVVGYEGDVRYAEYLWTAALMVFTSRIDPVWDASLSEAENIFRLRGAGIERRIIADAAWGRDAGKIAANRSKVQRIYLRECATRGEDARATGLGHNTAQFRDAYAESFYYEFARRMRQARDGVDASSGGAMVMHGRSERVMEAFYVRYPSARPTPRENRPQAAPDGAVYVPCPKCARNPSGTCREHPSTELTVAQRRAMNARLYGSSARAGRAAGTDAAARVDVVRGADRGTRVSPSTERMGLPNG